MIDAAFVLANSKIVEHVDTFDTKFACVMMAPFGSPVVPDV